MDVPRCVYPSLSPRNSVKTVGLITQESAPDRQGEREMRNAQRAALLVSRQDQGLAYHTHLITTSTHADNEDRERARAHARWIKT